MKVSIKPSKASGTVVAPPSKSVAHRLLICAALADGVSHISNLAFSKDIEATLNCLNSLGIKTEVADDTVTVYGGRIDPIAPLLCNESGSTLRFMIPVAMLSESPATLCGTKRLFSRSLEVYESAFCDYRFEKTEDSVTVQGRLQPGEYRIRGDISSQFITGLMFALPLLDGDSILKIDGRLESAPYVDITMDCLKKFGVDIIRTDTDIIIKGNQRYLPCDRKNEGDMSNAAFFDAFNVIGGSVTVLGLDKNTLQGDKIYREYFEKVKQGNCTLDVTDCPDLAPILMACGAACEGVTLIGTRRLKIKESDRGDAMAKELAKFNVPVKVLDNSIEVGCGIKTPTAALYGHNDHRIVMSLAVLCTLCGGVIDGCEAVNKSLPDFFERIGSLGVKYEVE